MILGVTGGIATGKSSVAARLNELGAALVSADELAREAVAPGSAALVELVDCFGEGILAEDGRLDRAALADIVFVDAGARRRLEAITHPAIARLAEERLKSLAGGPAPLVVYEAPLLFEAGAESRVDQVLVVTADAELQLARLMSRDGLDRDAAEARIGAQMPLAEKVRRADYLIDNSGSRDELLAEADLLYAELISPGHG